VLGRPIFSSRVVIPSLRSPGLAGTGRTRNLVLLATYADSLPWRNPHNVVLNFYLSRRKFALNMRLHFTHRRNPIPSRQPPRIIEQNHVQKRMAQNHLQLRRKPLLIALLSNPPVIPRIEPKQRRTSQQFQNLGHNHSAIPAKDLHVWIAGEKPFRPLRQFWHKLNRVDAIEIPFRGRDHLAVISAGFHQGAQPKSLPILSHHVLLQQMRRALRPPAQNPIPIIRIMSERLVCPIKRSALEQLSKRFQDFPLRTLESGSIGGLVSVVKDGVVEARAQAPSFRYPTPLFLARSSQLVSPNHSVGLFSCRLPTPPLSSNSKWIPG
jgi:hypothetical protein